MKRQIAWILVLTLLPALSACGAKKVPSLADRLENLPAVQEQTPVRQEKPQIPQRKPEAQETPVEEPPEQERVLDHLSYDGIYRLDEQNEEGIQTYMEVRSFPEFLLLELFQTYEGSTYSFWVEEFWPDEGYVIGDGTQLQGKSQEFSLMSRGNLYSAMPMDRTITLTEDGMVLQYKDLEEDHYVLDDSFGPYHTPEEDLRQRLQDMYTVDIEQALVGCWGFWDGWRTIRVTFEESGGFRFLSKEPGYPVRVLNGVWGVDQQSGDIQIVAELVGDGQFPYHVTWQWRLDENSFLYLVDEEEFLLKELGNDVGFWRAEETDPMNMTQLGAMGYVWDSYDLFGEYTDQYGTDYSYRYRLPVFLEDTGDLAKINAEILDRVVPIIEEELTAMERQEFLSTETVDWGLFVTEEIVTLHVYSLSWEVEQHQTWYYDLRSGKQVDSGELLRRIGVDETAFLETVRGAAEAYYIEAFAAMPEQDRADYGYYTMLDWTVSDEAVNLDLPIFVDRTGNLCVYTRIGSVAGAGEFWVPLYPFESAVG